MQPAIRYVRTSDGVNIAYYTMGEGPPFLMVRPMPHTHLTLEWELMEPVFTRLAESFTLIRYDPRGLGLSDPVLDDLSLEPLARDVDAVLDAARVTEPIVLYAWDILSMHATAYAATRPERISRLILVDGGIRAPIEAALYKSLLDLARVNWTFTAESLAHSGTSWSTSTRSRSLARLIRDGLTPAAFVAWSRALSLWDLRAAVREIRVPTMLLGQGQEPYVSITRELAALVPGAQVITFEWMDGDLPRDALRALGRFIGRDDAEGDGRRVPKPPLQSGITIVMFADIVDSTSLTERVGDRAFREQARALDEAVRSIVRAHGGRPVDGKLLGDGVLATFQVASSAISAALASTRAADLHNLQLHVGLHAGDVIREDENVYGGAVNIAARISSLSAPGEVLVSRTVAELGRTSAGVRFEDRGDNALKGIADPQRIFAVISP